MPRPALNPAQASLAIPLAQVQLAKDGKNEHHFIRPHGMQVLMFSATLHSQEVKDVAAKVCQQPIVVDLKVWHKYSWRLAPPICTLFPVGLL